MSHDEFKSENCLNCGYQFKDADNYCPDCGQQNHSLKVPFKHLILEVLEGTIHLDTKIFQTFKGLLLHPGFLTREFNTGKRATYVPPVRIYVFVSFIFFMLASMLPGNVSTSSSVKETEKKGIEKKEHKQKSTGVSLFAVNDEVPEGMSQKQYDSLVAMGKKNNSKFGNFVMEKSLEIKDEEGKKEFKHKLMKNISYLMFILMPLFALIVFLFHLKKGHYYYEFLIYSIHLHSFLFLLFSVFILLSKIWGSGYLFLIMLLISTYYLIVSMKNSFPQDTSAAVLKSLSVSVIYALALGICLLATLLISVLLM
ncbi:MAG: DUF3667 domain-containing protein [Bacteroidota bacterium]